jgi:hypothetical protein
MDLVADVTDMLADKARCQAAIEHGESALGSLIKESMEARGGSIPCHASALSAIPGVGGFAVPPGAGAEGAVIALVSSEHASNEAFSSPPFGICIPCPPGGGSRRVDVAYYYPEQHAFECILQAKLLKEDGNRYFPKCRIANPEWGSDIFLLPCADHELAAARRCFGESEF